MIDISSVAPMTGATTINVAIEIPKGTIAKYEYDNLGKELRVVRFLNRRYPYPFNYGCIPNTLEEDGDMLDAIVLCDEPLSSGTIIECTVWGIVETIDTGEQDNKVICIPSCIRDKVLTNRLLNKVLRYLRKYKYPNQNSTKIGSFRNTSVAMEDIKCAIDRFNNSKYHQN